MELLITSWMFRDLCREHLMKVILKYRELANDSPCALLSPVYTDRFSPRDTQPKNVLFIVDAKIYDVPNTFFYIIHSNY